MFLDLVFLFEDDCKLCDSFGSLLFFGIWLLGSPKE